MKAASQVIFPFPEHYVLFQIVWHGMTAVPKNLHWQGLVGICGMCDIWQWRNFGALLLVVTFLELLCHG